MSYLFRIFPIDKWHLWAHSTLNLPLNALVNWDANVKSYLTFILNTFRIFEFLCVCVQKVTTTNSIEREFIFWIIWNETHGTAPTTTDLFIYMLTNLAFYTQCAYSTVCLVYRGYSFVKTLSAKQLPLKLIAIFKCSSQMCNTEEIGSSKSIDQVHMHEFIIIKRIELMG